MSFSRLSRRALLGSLGLALGAILLRLWLDG